MIRHARALVQLLDAAACLQAGCRDQLLIKSPCTHEGRNTGAADVGQASTSGRMPSAALPARSYATIASLTKTGVPKPRPEVEEAMSTINGGHIMRQMAFAQTLPELKLVMHEQREMLTPMHMAAAARQLERLCRQSRTAPMGLTVKTIAGQIEDFAAARAPRLSTGQVASIVRGLTSSGHAMQAASLLSIAAVLTAQDCQRMRLTSDQEWKDIVWGFAMQGFKNPVFWERLAGVAAARVSTWDADRAASVLKNMVHGAGTIHVPFTQAAVEHITAKAASLMPVSIADALYAIVCVQRARAQGATQRAAASEIVSTAQIAALQAAGAEKLADMDGKFLALFISSLSQLGAGSKELAAAAATAARALPPAELRPLYISKLVAGCSRMQLEDPAFYGEMAARVQELLPWTAPSLRQVVVQVIKAAPGGAELPALAELEKQVKALDAKSK